MAVQATATTHSAPSTDGPVVPGFRPGAAPGAIEDEVLDEEVEVEAESEEFDDSFGITVSIRQVIGAGIILGLGIVILNQVFSMNLVQNTSGPFNIDTVTSPLGAALGILGLAIFVGGARIIMNQMGGSGRGGL